MKKITAIVFFVTGIITVSFAQISGGPKAGANFSNFYLDTSLEGNQYKIGFNAGGFFNYEFNDNFSVQPEIAFSSKGSKIKYETTGPISKTEITADYTINYIDIPLLFQCKLKTGSFFCVGPQLSMLAKVNYKYEAVTAITGQPTQTVSFESGDKDGLNTVDFALAVGTGYQSESGINFSLRANFGLADVFPDDGDSQTKILCFQAALGYAFGYRAGRSGYKKSRR